jgi:hypothetical protein
LEGFILVLLESLFDDLPVYKERSHFLEELLEVDDVLEFLRVHLREEIRNDHEEVF